MSSWLRKRRDGRADEPAEPEHRVVVRGTVAERAAFVERRRSRAQERDAARFRYAGGAIDIAPGRGYAIAAPGTLAGVDEVVRAGNAVIDGIGHDAIVSGRMKGGFMATKLLAQEELALDSPYLRFALHEDVLRSIAAYLGVVPILTTIDIWYSVAGPNEAPRSSQLWHLDHADTTQVKIFVNLNDVTPPMGPLTIIDAETSEKLAARPGYDFGKGNRITDDVVQREVAPDAFVSFDGPARTAAFVDTSRCFHFGSRVEPGAEPRRVAMFQYLTPYAFEFGDEPQAEAPFRELGPRAGSELEQLALGSA